MADAQGVGLDQGTAPVVPARTVLAACAGILAAWVSAGSTGLLAEPLRIAVTGLALFAAWVAQPGGGRWPRAGVVALLVLVALPLVLPVSPIHGVLVVAALLAVLASGQSDVGRRALSTVAAATLALAIYQVARLAVPTVWLLADSVGGALGRLAGSLTGRPLSIGATFAALDVLVLMLALWGLWLWRSHGPRWPRAAWAVAAIGVGHLLYLGLLAFSLDLLAQLPKPEEPPFVHPYVPPQWQWSGAVRLLIPWNLPLVAALIQLSVAALMIRWGRWAGDASDPPTEMTAADSRPQLTVALRWATPVLAVLLALSAAWCGTRTDLSDKRIVANQRGWLNWDQPENDRYGAKSSGMFGMLPRLAESLGGEWALSAEFEEEDLATADVVLLLHPGDSLESDQCERLAGFVRGGGSLLVVGGPAERRPGWDRSLNELLHPTSIAIRHDVATSATSHWQHALDLGFHPSTSGMNTRASHYFSDAGGSLRIGFPARPLVVGQWGWSDPGSDAVLTSTGRLEQGERLGDVVLAAEQRLGAGTVVVVGDAFSWTNEGGVRGYHWTARLLSYLAQGAASPQVGWRQVLSLVLVALILFLIIARDGQPLVAAALVTGLALAVCGSVSRERTRVIPDGRQLARDDVQLASRLAYIDASHLEAYSDLDWGFDAINGLALTLMRQGYLTLTLPEVTRERLERAAVVVSVAPARPFSRDECRFVHEFVERGGLLISTVGAEEASASRALLDQFDLRIPMSPVPPGGRQREPEPMGRFRSLYLDARDYGAGDYKAGVLFHAGWPVELNRSRGEVLVPGKSDDPIVVCSRVGRGAAVLIGDTGFAMNKNLEYVTGDPFEGLYENAHFWRWMLSRVSGQPEWLPPLEAAGHADGAETVEEELP